jgi:hypothetical protein
VQKGPASASSGVADHLTESNVKTAVLRYIGQWLGTSKSAE